ncbi:16S rRNA (guanine(527)-N(7))-methyltransferase RsmG [Megasphaera vaginalis (ex Bordigoni et al. 2020)]|uniref:16S rRNA (guanine(527)-N(7))-methyltransferase RsmG n=1 Tax=Megasphaera vaginalis (ex Bordigoni et al. 2020) TaxID=2045301 RepID=UPI000C7C6E76|nr:16S rRNA (guanine(527)-N(7))-methyltransferase RsmG [Megasphaera vaginalis (ex Bordigoni et al. 2020)]
MFLCELTAALAPLGIVLTKKQRQQFDTFAAMLVEKNKVMNLTAITEPKEIAVKHMADSLSCYEPVWFPENASLLDLGTGAGFPGVPLAILRPDLEITFFDSLQKRLRFVAEVTTALGLERVHFLHGRAEEEAHRTEYREAFDIVTTRAVARLNILSEWALPYVRCGGAFIALKGARYEEELAEAAKALTVLGGAAAVVRAVSLYGISDKRAVFYIRKEKESPKKYPRKPKMANKNPL